MPPAEGCWKNYNDHKRRGEPAQRGIEVESGQDLVKRPGRLPTMEAGHVLVG